MVTGRCLCGGVQFEVRGELGDTRLCYCELCRRANGSAFLRERAGTHRSAINCSPGESSIREFESSPGAFRAFCSTCGSPVYGRTIRDPDHIRVRLGTLVERRRRQDHGPCLGSFQTVVVLDCRQPSAV